MPLSGSHIGLVCDRNWVDFVAPLAMALKHCFYVSASKLRQSDDG